MKAFQSLEVKPMLSRCTDCRSVSSGRFAPGQIARGTHWIEEWVSPRGGMFISAENATGETLAEVSN